MLRHFLAALAYRSQKAMRDAPAEFGGFSPGHAGRTPNELVRHMTSVLGYARTFFVGGSYRSEPLPSFQEEIERFHAMVQDLADQLAGPTPLQQDMTPERLLQGPLSDAMTHAGQLALLRRLAGAPVPPGNFVFGDVRPDRLGPDQPEPVRPDDAWPEAPEGWRPQQR